MNKYYLAYGSNLSMAQMAQRCPDAVYVGTAELKDYQLLFKGSQSGSYLTVEPRREVRFRFWFGGLVKGMNITSTATKVAHHFITRK